MYNPYDTGKTVTPTWCNTGAELLYNSHSIVFTNQQKRLCHDAPPCSGPHTVPHCGLQSHCCSHMTALSLHQQVHVPVVMSHVHVIRYRYHMTQVNTTWCIRQMYMITLTFKPFMVVYNAVHTAHCALPRTLHPACTMPAPCLAQLGPLQASLRTDHQSLMCHSAPPQTMFVQTHTSTDSACAWRASGSGKDPSITVVDGDCCDNLAYAPCMGHVQGTDVHMQVLVRLVFGQQRSPTHHEHLRSMHVPPNSHMRNALHQVYNHDCSALGSLRGAEPTLRAPTPCCGRRPHT